MEQQIQQPLICGLPDDIGLNCLARVPRKYHGVLRCVSKRWRELVCSKEWHEYRKESNLLEAWIYVVCLGKYNQRYCYVLDSSSSTKCWKQWYGIPSFIDRRGGIGLEALGTKLYFMGGIKSYKYDTDESTTYCYDASSNTWTETNHVMNRAHFVSEVLDDKIYAFDGLTISANGTTTFANSWESYDSCTNSWSFYSDPNMVQKANHSFVLDGKIYIGNINWDRIDASVYVPSSGSWQRCDSDLLAGWQGPAVVVDGTLYVIVDELLMMWQKDIRKWVAIEMLCHADIKPSYKLVAVGKSIYVIGKGLSTVVIDVSNVGNVEARMVSACLPELTGSEGVVLRCKSLAI